MAKRRKKRVQQAEIVARFAARLREVRKSRGMTQADLAEKAHVTASYIWRLETGGAAPGIDLVDRLAAALGTTPHDLMPLITTPDTVAVLQEQARSLFETVMTGADREMLSLLNQFLARLAETPDRRN
jgi:transcriptional regulator with XRE-family HTH domain